LKINRAFRFLILAAVLLGTFPRAGYSQEVKYNEYQVKAAFIYNVSSFIEWPEMSPAGGAIPKELCVLGTDPMGPNLESFRGKALRGTELTVTRIGSLKTVRDCRILYVAISEKDHLDDVIEALAGSPVLTISDIEDGARQGVMINFYLEEEMVRFEINIEAMRRAGLNASAKLLKLARIVR